jgi:hypothetical protein
MAAALGHRQGPASGYHRVTLTDNRVHSGVMKRHVDGDPLTFEPLCDRSAGCVW